MLPTLVPGDDENPPIDRADVLDMCFDLDALIAFGRDGIRMRDVLDDKVPGYDADEIIAEAMEDTGSSDGPWSLFEGLNS